MCVFYPKVSEANLGVVETSVVLTSVLIDSEIAGPSKLKLGWMIENMCKGIILIHQCTPGSGWWNTGASTMPWG